MTWGAGKDQIKRKLKLNATPALICVAPDSKPDKDADMAEKPGVGFRCASGYPQNLWSSGHNQVTGELVALGGTPPLRLNFQNFAEADKVVWARCKGTNVQVPTWTRVWSSDLSGSTAPDAVTRPMIAE